jgi:hypothetical protein
MVRKVIGDNYEIIDRNNFTYVRGSHCLTIEGKMSMLVKNSAHIVAEGGLSVTSHKDTSIETAGTTTITGKNINVSSTESLNLITEGSLNLQGKNINLYAKGGSISQKAGQDFSMESGSASTFSVKGGQSLLLDAAIIKSKMGANSIREIAFGALPLPEAKTIDTTPIPVLPRDVVPESFFAFDGGEPDSAAHIQSKIENGVINNNVVPIEIPTETISNTVETKISTTITNETVVAKTTTTDKVANTSTTITSTTNTNQTSKIKNITTYPTTDAEIRAFQESKGLKVDGVIGPKTQEALTAAGIETPSAIVAAAKQAATDLAGTATATGTKIATFASDTVDAGAKVLNKAITAVKNILPSSKW